ncbi:MAG TPA: TIGR03000 domain-containing protein [Vicinamibacterales bacterium]|nr:TIGR03000 domain-containing protein [Vicinamibacterales bacterium]
MKLLTLVLIPGLLALEGIAPARPTLPERTALQSTASLDSARTSRISVTLPADDAVLVVNGETIRGDGASRTVETVPPNAGAHRYTLTVTWEPNTYTKMTRTKTIELRAGETVSVDLAVDDPTDRVRVIYHPTPADVAEAMVTLAAVGPDDVVYEPGCGDARITTAAIRAGARRGICIDIDPDQAFESKTNVELAGLADRIDVREGDALDVKDLSDVSVVFLYMGDHFNMLVRPVLWRELKVGSRIVSHRFTMGDWTPDRTVAVSSDQGGIFELHLWTITEEIKQKLASR